jgi:hypothetical protein
VLDGSGITISWEVYFVALSMSSKKQANPSERGVRSSRVKIEKKHNFVKVFLPVSLILT